MNITVKDPITGGVVRLSDVDAAALLTELAEALDKRVMTPEAAVMLDAAVAFLSRAGNYGDLVDACRGYADSIHKPTPPTPLERLKAWRNRLPQSGLSYPELAAIIADMEAQQ